MQSDSKMNRSSGVRVVQKKKYGNDNILGLGCFLRVFCCKCIYCCQSFDFSLLTSEHRKDVFHNMIRKYVRSIENEPNIIIDPLFILLGLLLGNHDSQLNNAMMMQIDNRKQSRAIFSKEDLEFYLPQLCTYLVFHEEMHNVALFNLMERTCKIDLQFSLRYYFYMTSLEVINQNTEFRVVMKYNSTFRKKINSFYGVLRMEGNKQIEQTTKIVEKYHFRPLRNSSYDLEKLKVLNNHSLYRPVFHEKQQKNNNEGIFQSTISFLMDLVFIGKSLLKSNNRKQDLQKMLCEMNTRFPAQVYIPLLKHHYKNMKILGIIFQECRVFSTKERAPFHVCLEAFEQNFGNSPSEEKNIRSTHMKKSLRRAQLFEQDNVESEFYSDSENEAQRTIVEETNKEEIKKNRGILKRFYSFIKRSTQSESSHNLQEQQETETNQTLQTSETLFLFGQSSQDQEERIKKISPYGNLPRYKLIHLVIKTNDDLRQESFAMQLLQQFNRIFQMQNLNIHVIPYQVLPLDHNSGVIEFLKDAITIDGLRKRNGSLKFIKKDPNKVKNFIRTLAGYSLVTYLLQVKDRHNGNIMVRKDGSIIHIDYGFFLSHAPGQGVQLQKNVPFKLTNEYVDVLGGPESKLFTEFRKLFFQGYTACHKHQHRILILSKLMYSSHGTTMPCFMKGNQAIQHLQQRFNPTGIRTDGDMSLFCQKLINKSIDNWRGRWYDAWQYYVQGILY